jgi:hypothetical protein
MSANDLRTIEVIVGEVIVGDERVAEKVCAVCFYKVGGQPPRDYLSAG